MGAAGGARHTADGPEVFRVGKYQVNLSIGEALCGDRRIKLPWRSFEALQILIEAKGEVVDRTTFFERLWPDVAVGESSLNQCIAKLRRDLGEPPDGGLIETVARRGYRLAEPPERVWSRAADPVPTDIFVPQPRLPARWRWVAWALVAVVAAVLGGTYLWSGRSKPNQARSMVKEGFRQVRENRAAGLAAANNLFRQALDMEPGLASGYAGLAEVMARSVEASRGQALIMAERAVRLDPGCAECQAIAGWILMGREWRFREAEPYLERAAGLDPRNPRILLWHAQMLACSGSLERALAEIDRAHALDFKDPAVAAMRAGILYLSGRYEKAITSAREALGLKPDHSSAYDWIYRTYIRLDRVEEALAAKAALNTAFLGLSSDSRFEMEKRWLDAYHQGGRPRLVEALLAGNADKPALDHHRYERATWKIWIGDQAGALDELEHIFDFHPFDAVYVGVDPIFAPLHGEARFRQLLSRMGLER